MVAACLTLLLLGAAADECGNPHLARAVEQVRRFQQAEALETLEEAVSWRHTTPETLARVHLYIGLAHAGLAREAEAIEAFRAALLLEPDLSLPEDVSPRIRDWWGLAGGRLPAAPPRVPPAPAGPVIIEPAATHRLRIGRPPRSALEHLDRRGADRHRVAALIGGLVLWRDAAALASQAAAQPSAGAAVALHSRAQGQARTSSALVIAGGVLAARGGVLIVVPFE